jgi:hypothetical protein
MATLMDLLMRRQDRGYDVKPGGPSAIDMLLQREKRGYATSAPPPAAPQSMMPTDEIRGALDRMRGTGPLSSSIGLPGLPIPDRPGPLSADLTPPQGVTPQPQPQPQVPPNLGLAAPEPPGPLPRALQPNARMAQTAAQVGPVNMNVIKGLNQYAQMNNPQAYADQFAGGDLSKIRARTYRDEEGNAYNDYYVKGLLGG